MTVGTLVRTATSSAASSGLRYQCNACRVDVSDIVHLRCAVCEDVDVCADCFAEGKEFDTHANDHAYRVIDTLNYPVLDLQWGADEEMKLLEAIDMYGMGNWADIADYLGTKTLQEVEAHYLHTYIESPTCPLPASVPGQPPSVQRDHALFAPTEIAEFRARRKEQQARREQEPPTKEDKQPKPVVTSQPLCHELTGYMPYRQEFDVEYENEAEAIISQLAFNDDDSQDDIDLKLKILEIYNSKLDKRAERKNFILNRQLVNLRQHQNAEKRRKEYKDVYNQHRVFARFQTPADFELFMDGIINEQKIRAKIAQLQEWRTFGITSLAGGEVFEVERKRRQGLDPTSRKMRDPITAFGLDRTATSRFRATGRERDEVAPPPSKMTRRGTAVPLDLTTAEDSQLLSAKEFELCSTLRILPKAYLAMKEMMIQENNQQGYLRRAQARRMIRMDVNKTGKVYDYFVAVGWVRPAPVSLDAFDAS